jgi:lysozyme family protein
MTLDTIQLLLGALAVTFVEKWLFIYLYLRGQRAQIFPPAPAGPVDSTAPAVIPPAVAPQQGNPPAAPPVVPPVVVQPPAVVPASNFDRCVALVLQWEGGNDNDPNDPGGRTSRGILQKEWDVWRQSHPGLPADVWQAPQAQVIAIYKQNYWDMLSCGSLPPGVDYAVFDYGVNSGITRAARVLEGIVGTTVDGHVGPLTIAATAKLDPATVVNKICDERMAFLRGLSIGPKFGHGWTTRVSGVRTGALTMAGAVPKVTTPPPAAATGGIVLQHNTWPTQAQVRAGVLGDPHDTSQHVEVVCPWLLNGGKTKSITIHRMFAPSLARCLSYIWEHPFVNKSQAKIDDLGYGVFDGSWDIRPIAGSAEPSMHSWAAAMDWNAALNPQHAPLSRTKFKSEKEEPPNGSLIVWVFEQEGWTWGGRWSAADIDAMHIQGPRVR